MTTLGKPRISLLQILFFLYCLFILWTVVFKNTFSVREIAELVRPRSLNLIPFYYDCSVSVRFHIREVLLNILLFFPFGVYLKMLDIPSRRAVLTGFLFSLGMELCQLIFALGACDITDLITNTTGTAAGVLLYHLALLLFKNRRMLHKILLILASSATVLLGILLLMLFLANRQTFPITVPAAM